jgi:hypothetical protein
MVRGGNSRHSNSQPRRRHFSTIQEIGTEESNRDEEVEQENEQSGRNLSRVVGLGEAGSHSERQHARCHADSGEHEELAATEAVDGEEGDETGEEFPGEGATGEDAGGFGVKTETLLENDLWLVNNVIA